MVVGINATAPEGVARPNAGEINVAGPVVGIDIGGTKSHGIRILDGVVTAESVTGSANVQSVSREHARENLTRLFAELDATTATTVYAGSGGIDTAEDAEALRGLIRPFAPDAEIRVVHDTRLLLAAGGASTGIAVIAGTGSAAWGTNAAGAEARAGGWGYLLGDEGSGYWFGREAVRHSLTLTNRGLPQDRIGTELLASCGLRQAEDLIGHFHGGTGRRYWAQRAHLVFDAAAEGHPGALELIDRAGADLAALAIQVARQLDVSGPVILGGGVGVHQSLLQERFAAHLAAAGLHEMRALTHDPVRGVLQLLRSGG